MIIFFDIDDTLIDQRSSEKIAALRMWEALDFRKNFTQRRFLTEWEETKNRSISRYLGGEITFMEQRRDRIRHFFPNQSLDDRTADAHFEIYRESFEASWDLFPDVIGCLDHLKEFRLGIISNGDSEQQRMKLRNTHVFDRFEQIVISGDCGISKPRTEIFLKACQMMNSRPQDCVYVGDSIETDMKGCASAGMRGVLIDREGTESLNGFDTIGSLSELKDKLTHSPH